MSWILIVFFYAAPANAVDLDGPWKLGMTKVVGDPVSSEEQCKENGRRFIAAMHEGMLAPMRYKCITAPSGLPVGAPR